MTIDELKKIAEAATPGPWEVRYRDIDNHERCKIWSNYGWVVTNGDLPRMHHEPSMEFIATLNPATVLQLLADYEAMKAALECCQHHLDGDGDVFGTAQATTRECLAALKFGKEEK